MHFIYGLPVCPPICPPFISSSEENFHQRRKFLPDEKLNPYNKSIGRHFLFSTKEDFDDEEFDEISLSDNYYVSLLEKKREMSCVRTFFFIYFNLTKEINHLLLYFHRILMAN
jgi:hypothetical protein